MMIDSPSQYSRQRAFIASSMSAPTFPTFSPSSSRSPSPSPNPNPSPSSSSSSSRLLSSSSSSSFSIHNPRIALALLPSAAFLLDLGGSPVTLTLTLGLFISYILDSLRLHPAASFFSIWLSLLSSQLAFFFTANFSLSSTPLTALALLLSAQTNFLIGVWFSLQFKFLHLEYPSIIKTLHRLLFACIPICVPSLLTWAAVSALGMANAAYYLMFLSCTFYWLFTIPRPDPILAEFESCVHTLYLLFAPVAFRLASHHAVLDTSAVCDLLLLFFVPFLFQLYASTRGALWWVTRDEYQVQRIRVVNGAVALVVVVVCLEIRVVFHSFGRYVAAPPPFNYLLVTVAMLGGAGAVGVYAVGMVRDAVTEVAFTALAVLVSGAGAIVVGFPVLVCYLIFHFSSGVLVKRII